MLEIVAAEIQLSETGQQAPGGQEKQIVLGQTTVLQVEVDERPLGQTGQDLRETVFDVAVAEVEALQEGQGLQAGVELIGNRWIDGDVDAVWKADDAKTRQRSKNVDEKHDLVVVVRQHGVLVLEVCYLLYIKSTTYAKN